MRRGREGCRAARCARFAGLEVVAPPWRARSHGEAVPGALASPVSRAARRLRGMEVCGCGADWPLVSVATGQWPLRFPRLPKFPTAPLLRVRRCPRPACPPRPPAGTLPRRGSSPVAPLMGVSLPQMSLPNGTALALRFSPRRRLAGFCSKPTSVCSRLYFPGLPGGILSAPTAPVALCFLSSVDAL